MEAPAALLWGIISLQNMSENDKDVPLTHFCTNNTESVANREITIETKVTLMVYQAKLEKLAIHEPPFSEDVLGMRTCLDWSFGK